MTAKDNLDISKTWCLRIDANKLHKTKAMRLTKGKCQFVFSLMK